MSHSVWNVREGRVGADLYSDFSRGFGERGFGAREGKEENETENRFDIYIF